MALFARWLAGSEPASHLIAPLPIVRRLREAHISTLLFAGLWLLLGLIVLPIDWPRVPWPFFLGASLLLSFSACYLVLERSWKQFEQRRGTAAQGAHQWQAERQPLPDAQALVLPVTIRLRPSRWWTVWTGLLILLLPDGLLIVSTGPASATFWWGVFGVTVFTGGVLALLAAICWRARRVIEVTEEGISSSWPKTFLRSEVSAHWVRWQEARFFACYPARGSRKGGQVMIYELASERDVVSWVWVQSKKTRRPLEEPLLPFEEHRA
ncbi:hypothetical protein [Ktedonobacter racemifer]|uniref:Uncharacterized protein n=1 Tax=Ktedonobacter racemifer DSM 44963 TaxID=485913 RepID=D6TY32_KTERA|nr:hypothetical protein [Ktedonobacter racemifer]EFH85028.1 hypothetical protein Krac_6163 [Ktedonobacter racemifer DSM 44963]